MWCSPPQDRCTIADSHTPSKAYNSIGALIPSHRRRLHGFTGGASGGIAQLFYVNLRGSGLVVACLAHCVCNAGTWADLCSISKSFVLSVNRMIESVFLDLRICTQAMTAFAFPGVREQKLDACSPITRKRSSQLGHLSGSWPPAPGQSEVTPSLLAPETALQCNASR